MRQDVGVGGGRRRMESFCWEGDRMKKKGWRKDKGGRRKKAELDKTGGNVLQRINGRGQKWEKRPKVRRKRSAGMGKEDGMRGRGKHRRRGRKPGSGRTHAVIFPA